MWAHHSLPESRLVPEISNCLLENDSAIKGIFSMCPINSFQNHGVRNYNILTTAKRVYFTKSKQY